MRQLWSAVLIYSDMYFYPIIVFGVDTSSFANKVAQNVFKTSFFRCQVQGSLLMENKVLEWIACRLAYWLILLNIMMDTKWIM